MRRVAIYGGTFDPVHNGHLEVARRVLEIFELDEVLFVPASVPPHKRNARITSELHRFAMLALATQTDEQLRISTIELDSPEQPYAVETVGRLRAELGVETELFFLMGADSWLEISSWHDWQRLLSMCHFIVVTRPEFDLDVDAPAPLPVVKLVGDRKVTMNVEYDRPHVFITDAVMSEVSATAIRLAAKMGDRGMLSRAVPIAVAGYIEKYTLYRN